MPILTTLSRTGMQMLLHQYIQYFNATKMILTNQNIVGINGDAVLNINPFYFSQAFNDISNIKVDEFHGTLSRTANFITTKPNIEGIGTNQNLTSINFEITGFDANIILIPSIITPIVIIIAIVAIVAGVLIYRNKKKQVIATKAGYLLAKKQKINSTGIKKYNDKNIKKYDVIKSNATNTISRRGVAGNNVISKSVTPNQNNVISKSVTPNQNNVISKSVTPNQNNVISKSVTPNQNNVTSKKSNSTNQIVDTHEKSNSTNKKNSTPL